MFSTNSLNHIKVFVTSLCIFLLIILVVIVTAITYMSRLCQRIRRNSSKSNVNETSPAPKEMTNTGVNDTNYALENLGIQTVYTETNDAICNEYYSNLLATQYSPKTNEDMQLLSLDLYKINKGPPDLIPTFYYNEEGANSDILHLNSWKWLKTKDVKGKLPEDDHITAKRRCEEKQKITDAAMKCSWMHKPWRSKYFAHFKVFRRRFVAGPATAASMKGLLASGSSCRHDVCMRHMMFLASKVVNVFFPQFSTWAPPKVVFSDTAVLSKDIFSSTPKLW